MLILTCLRHCI